MDYFKKLNAINVNGKVEKKNGLTYLSWAWAIAEVLDIYPDMTYEVVKFNGLPYVYDEKAGYMVYTKVTIEGVTREMWLPVMDGANQAMKAEPYKYKTKYGEKTVEAATMFDINKTIMRCLTKNLAMFGLGLYIYAGEDLPEEEAEEKKAKAEEKKAQASKPKVPMSDAKLNDLKSLAEQAGVELPMLCEAYKVQNIVELTEEQYENAAKRLLATIKKNNGGK